MPQRARLHLLTSAAAVVAAVALGWALPVRADDAPGKPAKPAASAAAQAAPTGTAPAMRATVDPKTGQLVPGPAEGTAPSARAVAPPQAPVIERFPDGSARVRLPESMMMTMRMTIDADGRAVTTCEQGGHSHPHPQAPAQPAGSSREK